jgi:hypothetical protein
VGINSVDRRKGEFNIPVRCFVRVEPADVINTGTWNGFAGLFHHTISLLGVLLTKVNGNWETATVNCRNLSGYE